MVEKNEKRPGRRPAETDPAALTRIYRELDTLRDRLRRLAAIAPCPIDLDRHLARTTEHQMLDRQDELLARASELPSSSSEDLKLKLAILEYEIMHSDLRRTPCVSLIQSARNDLEQLSDSG